MSSNRLVNTPQCLVGSINPIHRYCSPGFPIAFYHFFLAFNLREMGKKQAFLMVFSWVMGFPDAFVAQIPLSFPMSHGFFSAQLHGRSAERSRPRSTCFSQHLGDDHNIKHTLW